METLPVVQTLEYSAAYRLTRSIASALGQLLLAGSALWLVTLLGDLTRVAYRPEQLMLLGYPLLLLLFGLVISRMSNVFWAEMQFRSLLLDLSIEGTYTQSKLSTGQSIYDSTRSENVVVRSTITPWFLLSTLLTSTFVRPGSMNLEQYRHVLSFEKSDDTLAAILGELDEFFASREAIAGLNEVDLKSASQIFQMNEQTRALQQAAPVALEQEQAAGVIAQQADAPVR